jgi:secreted trypsin-like serine protease
MGRESFRDGRRAAAALLVLFCEVPANAVVTRHDVPKAAYGAQARTASFYCRMDLPDGGGALIGSEWVLTAAHLADDIKPGHKFHCGNEVVTAQQVIVHPRYDDSVGRHDLALVRLAAPAKLNPVALLRNRLMPGTLVQLVGHWTAGTGLTGADSKAPRQPLGATNRLQSVDEHWQRYVFDAPTSSSVTPLEGVSGGGDSGAPAYIHSGGIPKLVGVGSRNSDTNDDGIEQNYGDTDLFVNVPEYLPWIERVLAGRETVISRLAARYSDEFGLAGLIGSLALAAVVLAKSARAALRAAGHKPHS